MAKLKVPYTRRSGFSDSKLYMSYLECLKNCYNEVDGTFYDAILFIQPGKTTAGDFNPDFFRNLEGYQSFIQ